MAFLAYFLSQLGVICLHAETAIWEWDAEGFLTVGMKSLSFPARRIFCLNCKIEHFGGAGWQILN